MFEFPPAVFQALHPLGAEEISKGTAILNDLLELPFTVSDLREEYLLNQRF